MNTQNTATATERTPFENAVSTLINAVIVGQSKGAYSLEEASVINWAIKEITSPKPVEKEAVDEIKK
jgi:hypothetical protein